MHPERGRLSGKRVGVKQEIKVAACDVTKIRKGLDDLYLVIDLLLAVNCKTLLSQANNFVTLHYFGLYFPLWTIFSLTSQPPKATFSSKHIFFILAGQSDNINVSFIMLF